MGSLGPRRRLKSFPGVAAPCFKIESEAGHQLNIIKNLSKLFDNTPNITKT